MVRLSLGTSRRRVHGRGRFRRVTKPGGIVTVKGDAFRQFLRRTRPSGPADRGTACEAAGLVAGHLVRTRSCGHSSAGRADLNAQRQNAGPHLTPTRQFDTLLLRGRRWPAERRPPTDTKGSRPLRRNLAVAGRHVAPLPRGLPVPPSRNRHVGADEEKAAAKFIRPAMAMSKSGWRRARAAPDAGGEPLPPRSPPSAQPRRRPGRQPATRCAGRSGA